MFEHLTDQGRAVVVLAQEEARMLNHKYIGTEHILLGLIHEGDGVAAKAMESLGISLEAVRQQVEEIIGKGPQTPYGHLPFTPRAKVVLQLSVREASQLGHNYIGTEHILLGLIREGEGVAAQVLVKFGADLGRVRQQVIQLLSAGAVPKPVDVLIRSDPAPIGPDHPIGEAASSTSTDPATMPATPLRDSDERVEPTQAGVPELAEPVRLTGPTFIVPSITGDLTSGVDHLGIDQDARAFAGLIASKGLEPPLAIAVYGSWGSGKTFFMRRIQQHIETLATSEETSSTRVFHQSVLHVWFSAWHYADGNLWASLLHHIFSSLNGSRSRREAALDDLMTKVEGARQLKDQADAKVDHVERTLQQANQRIAEAKASNAEAIEGIKDLRARDLWASIILTAEDQGLKTSVEEAARDAGLGELGQSARDLAEATDDIVKTYSQIKVLATAGAWYKTPLAFSLYAALIVSAASVAAGLLIDGLGSLAGNAVLVIGQIAAIGSAAAAWLSRQAKVVRKFLTPAQRLRRRLDDRLAAEIRSQDRELLALKQQKELADSELAAALAHRAAVSAALASAERERAELSGSELLRRYLLERAGSGDYERYMGVVGLAHRDLRDLSDYLADALNDTESHERQIDRIVLYIDDLDRCQPATVTAVLDAVHLLLALPLFVVVVGIDPKWARQSLTLKHATLLGGSAGASGGPTALDYLEKIFQLNYLLPPLDLSGARQLLQANAASHASRSDNASDQRRSLGDADSTAADEVALDGLSVPAGSAAPMTEASIGQLVEAITLPTSTIDALADVACLVGSSPRRAKRFLSMYLLVRARLMADDQARTTLSTAHGADTAMILVALFVGAPLTLQLSGMQAEDCEDSGFEMLGELLNSVSCNDSAERARVAAFLEAEPEALNEKVTELRKMLKVVQPFAGIATMW